VTGPLRVLVADDHRPMLQGLRLALERGGFNVVAACADAESAVKAARRFRPDVCLLDVQMPGRGVAAAAEIKRRVPETAVVMITVSRKDADLFAALKAGASGYLLKDIPPDALPTALRGVLAGEAALPRTLVARLISEFQRRGWGRRNLTESTDGAEGLTVREWDVLELLSDELGTAEIAERLEISPGTVRTHVSMILRKLQVPTREAAVALMHGER
jgi:DNA-binding NarL/FixJ family response regulator